MVNGAPERIVVEVWTTDRQLIAYVLSEGNGYWRAGGLPAGDYYVCDYANDEDFPASCFDHVSNEEGDPPTSAARTVAVEVGRETRVEL